MDNVIIKKVHISTIKQGDTVLWDGHMKTISKHHLGYVDWIGHTLFGDSFNMGTVPVKKVLFKVPTNNGVIYR